MTNDTIKVGDNVPVLFRVRDGEGALVDLTLEGTEIRILATLAATTTELVPFVVGPGEGEVTHTTTGTLLAGTYKVEVEVTQDGKKVTSPTKGYGKLIVEPDLG
jgi:hypothetical protein